MSDNPKPITVIFPDKKTVERVIDLVVRKKPVGWGRKSTATYYNQDYARWAAKELQEIIDDGKPKVFRLSGRYTMNTLYLLINQAWLYLREESDDKQKWIDLWERCKVARKKGVGVIIQLRETFTDLPHGSDFVDIKEAPKWKRELNDYLEGDEIKPFHKSGLILSNEDVEQLKIELDGLDNIQYKIDNKEIKIIRLL
jgi:hypothetical protein